MNMNINSYSKKLSNTSFITDSNHSNKVPSRKSKDKDRLKGIRAISAELQIKIPKLAINQAVNHIKQPTGADFGHKEVNTPRVFSDLGASVFSILFKRASAKPLTQPPEYNQHFLSLIEEIEKYMSQIVAMPNNQNVLSEDMRKHRKFLEDSLDELEFLEKYFGITQSPQSAIINFKKLRPVILEVDPSGEKF